MSRLEIHKIYSNILIIWLPPRPARSQIIRNARLLELRHIEALVLYSNLFPWREVVGFCNDLMGLRVLSAA